MKMRLTRRSFKRKIIVFGILIFASIALISTGFAAWMISQGTQIEAGGNVEAGIVTDKSIGIENVYFIADSNKYVLDDNGSYIVATDYAVSFEAVKEGTAKIGFRFEPAYNDVEGRVKCNMTDGKYEALSITIKGKITTYSSLDTLVINLTIPDGVQKAIEHKYLVAPQEATNNINADQIGVIVPKDNMVVDTATDSATFEHTVSFAWGQYFGGLNPCYYYDTLSDGKNTSMAEIMACLNELRGLVHGLTPLTDDSGNDSYVSFGEEGNKRYYDIYDADELADENLVGKPFTLTIIANAN